MFKSFSSKNHLLCEKENKAILYPSFVKSFALTMPYCCVVGCRNRTEKGHKLYRLTRGTLNKAKQKLCIRNIDMKGPLPQCAYVCQDHFTEDQFEQRITDNSKFLKWNAIPTIFLRSKSIRARRLLERRAAIPISNNTSNVVITKQNIMPEVEQKTEIHENNKKHFDEITLLKSELFASQKEIHALRTIINRLQIVIEKLVDHNDEVDEMQNDPA